MSDAVTDPRFLKLSRENLLEAADKLFDALHAIVYATGSNRDFAKARELSIAAIRDAKALGFKPDVEGKESSWEALDVEGRDFFGVFYGDDYSPEPLAIFSDEGRANLWAVAQGPDYVVMTIRDLWGRAWNHLDPAPSRESESAS